MAYQEALEAAGAKVLAYESFGSYQGDWLALVEYNGQAGYVSGSYGSCSGCDSFQCEFGYDSEQQCDEHRYEGPSPADCQGCVNLKADYDTRLKAFGEGYLSLLESKDNLVKKFTEQAEWDGDAQEVLDWLAKN